jgi:hypothetical protein
MKSSLGLRDIQGLDAISIWPLAIGWWIVLGAVVTGLAAWTYFFLQNRKRQKTWQFKFLKKIEEMEAATTPENAQMLARELAEMVRRLAIQRFSREQCAHLQGEAWTHWLTEHDPSHFNWGLSTAILADAPYQPPGVVLDLESFRKTLHATKGWVI